MNQRISKRDVNKQFYRYCRLVTNHEKRPVNLVMQEGNERAGIAWKIYNGDNGTVVLRMTTNTREAFLMLSAANATLEML